MEEKRTTQFQAITKGILANLSIVVIIIGVMGGAYGLKKYIDSCIGNVINDDQFVKKVANHIRPFIIFDAKSPIATIYKNKGGMEYLERKPEIRADIKQRHSWFKIVITPKQHLASEPFLEQLKTPLITINKVVEKNRAAGIKVQGAIDPGVGVAPELEEFVIKHPGWEQLMRMFLIDTFEDLSFEPKYKIQAERGSGYQWIYKIHAPFDLEKAGDWRFRLEILG